MSQVKDNTLKGTTVPAYQTLPNLGHLSRPPEGFLSSVEKVYGTGRTASKSRSMSSILREDRKRQARVDAVHAQKSSEEKPSTTN